MSLRCHQELLCNFYSMYRIMLLHVNQKIEDNRISLGIARPNLL